MSPPLVIVLPAAVPVKVTVLVLSVRAPPERIRLPPMPKPRLAVVSVPPFRVRSPVTVMLEAILDKRRIFELYLNVVEWGNGIFGCEAAARRYFGTGASALDAAQAARLAAMAPNPRYYERHPDARGLARKIAIVLARMPSAELP